MDFPKRKSNRLQNFDYSQYGAYFVTICTKDKQSILCNIQKGTVLDPPTVILSPIGRIVMDQLSTMDSHYTDIFIDKYVIMPNHIHMIVFLYSTNAASTPANAKIPALVSTFKRFTNKKAEVELWQRSYHDHIIRNDRDYQMIWKYIDENPSKWSDDCYYPNSP